MRSQVSLELDGELSQLERAMVAAHLLRCGACRAYRTETTGFTQLLRAAPLVRLTRPVWVHTRRRLSVARYHGAVAAAMALAVVGLASQFAQYSGQRNHASQVIHFPTQDELASEVALLEVVAGEGGSTGSAQTKTR